MTETGAGALDGKVALITGAGSGIGRAAAGVFANAGARVVVADVDGRAVGEVAAEVGGIAVAGDVGTADFWERAIAVADDLGGIDVAYLNAGVYGHFGPIDELPLDVYERTISTNIGGVVLGTRACVPAMRATGRGGAIVVTASVAGIVAFEGNPVYTLTKQGVAGFVRALAPHLVADGITINAVCPGVVDTPMTVLALGGIDPHTTGFPLIAPETIAEQALHLATTPGTGRCRAVRETGGPVDWTFPTWSDLAQAPAS